MSRRALEPCILLALLITSALHTLSGMNSDAANLILVTIRVVLTGAFIGKRCKGARSALTDQQQSMLDSIPRDVRTVLSRLGVEPDIIRYATC
ncbi:hypothetical protein C2E23DRAFT_727959, partial [Lenzites betulinus]